MVECVVLWSRRLSGYNKLACVLVQFAEVAKQRRLVIQWMRAETLLLYDEKIYRFSMRALGI
jgi:hypothetical protein